MVEPEYRAMLSVDVKGSAGRGDTALRRVREVLRQVLADSVEESGIEWAACDRHDLGDGMRVIFPRATWKPRALHPLMYEVAVRLRAHNDQAGPPTRIRLRAALHAGDVHFERGGEVTGRPLETLARLLDAQPLRRALTALPESAPMALLISQHYYDDTVPHGYPGIDPKEFRQVGVAVKEYTSAAWLHVPGHALPPEGFDAAADDDSEPAEQARSDRPERWVQNVTGRDNARLFTVMGGNLHHHEGGGRPSSAAGGDDPWA